MFGRIFRISLFVLFGVFAAGMCVRLFPLLDCAAGLAGQVEARLGESGVEHPLTAVLLNFRGYDTMLEIGVLLAAVLAVWALDDVPRSPRKLSGPSRNCPLLRVALGILTPATIVSAGYMVWAGAYRPGGAFQAGAILGALMVVLIGSGVVPLPLSRATGLRVALGAGFFLFLLAAVLPLPAGGMLLQYPRGFAGSIMLAIETTLSISIGAAIGVFIAGVTSYPGSDGEKTGVP